MSFEFATAGRIVFGAGVAGEIGTLASPLMHRVLLVTGRDSARAEPLAARLRAAGCVLTGFAVAREPQIEDVREALRVARAAACDGVVAVGGGSALDAGKAVAALLANEGDPLDYLEVIGEGRKLTEPAAPLVAVPTTAGTGSEVTRNAVLGSSEHRVKVSLRSPLMLPRLALVDPELTLGLPPEATASTGMDALTQLIEPFVSRRATPLTDAVCRAGLDRAVRSLERAFDDGSDHAARTDMAFASLCGGLALANAGLGAAHGLAGPIGGMFPGAPHGALCARLLSGVMQANIHALCERAPESEARERYDRLARILTGNPEAHAPDGIARVRGLCDRLRIPALSAWGITPDHIDDIVSRARRASSMQANPVELTPTELANVLSGAL